MPCSKCILLVYSLNLSPISGEKSLLPVKCCFFHGNPRFNFTCTCWIICYHATLRVEILHILQLFLMYHKLYRGSCLKTHTTLVFFTFISIPQHLPVSISLSVTSCSAVSSLASSTRTCAYFTMQIMCFSMFLNGYRLKQA